MNANATAGPATFRVGSIKNNALEGFISLLVGAAFTVGLFVLMAHVEQSKADKPATVIEDMRSVSLPLEIPPPPVAQTETEPVSEMITGIDVAAAESPVHISLSVPILEAPPVPVAPPARIQTSTLRSDFKPRMDISTDFDHIFQQTEVDQKPTVVTNSIPFIPIDVRRGVRFLRVVVIMVIDAKGEASNIRVLTSSGSAVFDDLITKCVKDEWEFTPAIKKGRKVRCLVQRSVTVRWNSTPFDS